LKDLIDRAEQFVPPPEMYKNRGGQPLFGYDPVNLASAAVHFASAALGGRLESAAELLPQMQVTLAIETAALSYLRLLFPPALLQKYAPVASDGQRGVLEACVLALYGEFLHWPVSKVAAVAAEQDARYKQLWSSIVPNEDDVTPAQLGRFYNALSVPEADLGLELLRSRLAAACRAVPISLARQLKATAAFDYGGGGGWTASALAQSGLQAALIEENTALLDFARFRDRQTGVTNVQYLRETDVLTSLAEYRGRFGFGVCTEVLEHLLDVEGTVGRMAELLRPGGLLFVTASFGMYPCPSHLKCNVRRAGQEDALLAKFGFQPVPLEVGFPLPIHGGLYRRAT
jgi:SAM-dependent methyltransferase